MIVHSYLCWQWSGKELLVVNSSKSGEKMHVLNVTLLLILEDSVIIYIVYFKCFKLSFKLCSYTVKLTYNINLYTVNS